jgi:hypothetical protein
MKNQALKRSGKSAAEKSVSEMLILSDGRIFAHNVTLEMARVLAELNPADEAMRRRALRKNKSQSKSAT